MKITTAWTWNETDDAPELISAYDELTGDVWNGTPGFFTEAIAKYDGEVRICTISVASTDIYALFNQPTVIGSVDA